MEKDVSWSTFFEDNSRYADIINGLGCGGKQVVSNDDLTEQDSKSGSKVRDLVRKTALGVNFVIIGIENQDEVDYELPVRIMTYDVAHYKKQVSKISKQVKANAKGLEAGEYLYGFRKDSKLFPVVTFVLYAGIEPWKGPLYLHDIIDFTDIPESLRNMISDYKVQVIDIRRLENTSVFKTDVRYVFEFLRHCHSKKALSDLISKEEYFKNVNEETYEVLAKYATEKGILQIEKYKNKSGGVDMCKGLRDLIDDSKKEGREELIEKMLKKGMTVESVCEITEYDAEYVEKIKERIS